VGEVVLGGGAGERDVPVALGCFRRIVVGGGVTGFVVSYQPSSDECHRLCRSMIDLATHWVGLKVSSRSRSHSCSGRCEVKVRPANTNHGQFSGHSSGRKFFQASKCLQLGKSLSPGKRGWECLSTTKKSFVFNDAAKDSSHHWNIVGGHRHHQLWRRGLLPRHKHVLPKRGGWVLLLSRQRR